MNPTQPQIVARKSVAELAYYEITNTQHQGDMQCLVDAHCSEAIRTEPNAVELAYREFRENMKTEVDKQPAKVESQPVGSVS